MPTLPITRTITSVIEAALNRYLHLDPAILPRLSALAGKVIAVEFKGLDWNWYLLPAESGIQVRNDYEGIVDTKLRGTPWALLRLGTQKKEGDTSAIFSGDVEISGDVGLGQRFKQILDEIDIDWEELLSKVIGDIPAHQAGNAARRARAWGARSLETLAHNFAEYQQEEARNLPAAYEMAGFLKAVDVIRDDVERMAQRVRRLQDHLAKPQGGEV
ncbi:MAG: SCP2 sterol-binding domain-containing protein [Gammaproteobacteria bacterium]